MLMVCMALRLPYLPDLIAPPRAMRRRNGFRGRLDGLHLRAGVRRAGAPGCAAVRPGRAARGRAGLEGAPVRAVARADRRGPELAARDDRGPLPAAGPPGAERA